MSSGRYMAYSPSPSTAPHSPHIPGLRSAATAFAEQEKYISELLGERQKLSPFSPVLPHCYRLLNQEILRVTSMLGNAQILDQTVLEHARPPPSGGIYSNGGADLNGWSSPYQSEVVVKISLYMTGREEVNIFKIWKFEMGWLCAPVIDKRTVQSFGNDQRGELFWLEMSGPFHHSPAQSWLGCRSNSSGLIVKRTIRVDIPVDKYPNYNFVGRLLGPRGNSLKRVEASTECRVLIRGRGSIKDQAKEEMMRGKLGYEHLNEPLHILVEAELPVEIIDARLMQAREILEDLLKPVDEYQDFFKKQQLRELAMINGTLRAEDGFRMSSSASPFHNSLGMKRAKTQG